MAMKYILGAEKPYLMEFLWVELSLSRLSPQKFQNCVILLFPEILFEYNLVNFMSLLINVAFNV